MRDAADIGEVVALAHLGDDPARARHLGVGVVERQHAVCGQALRPLVEVAADVLVAVVAGWSVVIRG